MSLPDDPADAFALAYDAWVTTADVNDVDVWRAESSAEIAWFANEVRHTGRRPAVPWPSTPVGEFVLLAALDTALAACNPRSGAPCDALTDVTVRLALTGDLSSTTVDGALVPRYTTPGRVGETTDRLADAFHHVTRISAQHASVLTPRRLPSTQDLPSTVGFPANPLRVAFAPALTTLADVDIATGQGLPGLPKAHWYSLAPVTARLLPAIPDLLADFDASGAHIALLPEAAADGALLDAWQAEMRRVPRPDASPLRLVLIGTGPVDGEDPAANMAVVLQRDTGREVMRHEKFAPFHMDPATPDSWGLSGVIAGGETRHERIRKGTASEYLESAAGRIAIMVCEDVTRHSDVVPDALIACGPSHILVPVFAQLTRKYRWEWVASERHVKQFGSTLLVANSTAVENAKRAAAGSAITDPIPFCMVASPLEAEFQIGFSDAKSSHVVIDCPT